MATTSISPLNAIAAYTLKTPPEGPRYVPLNFDFTAFTTWGVDLMMLTQQKHMSSVQSLYVDNSANNAAVEIDNGQGQTLIVPAGYQAYLPIILNDNPKFNVSSTGTSCQMLAMNFMTFPFVWNTAP